MSFHPTQPFPPTFPRKKKFSRSTPTPNPDPKLICKAPRGPAGIRGSQKKKLFKSFPTLRKIFASGYHIYIDIYLAASPPFVSLPPPSPHPQSGSQGGERKKNFKSRSTVSKEKPASYWTKKNLFPKKK